MHGHDRVRPETRQRVREVIEELGYIPDSAAQSLSRRRKEVIGLVSVAREAQQYDVENMSLLFYDEVLHGVEARLRDERDWSLLISFLTSEDSEGFSRLQSLSAKVDGLLIGEGIVSAEHLARLAERVPIVVIAGQPHERVVDNVVADNRAGAVALVTHLVKEHGRRRIFHVDGPATSPDARERRAALEAVLAATPRCRLVGTYRGLFSVRSGEQAAEQLLASGGALPDAIVCANDQMAIGVLQEFSRAGVRVPEEVAVVGFDDIYPGNLSDPPLTTVHQPMRLLGERACSRLLERIARPNMRPTLQMLPTELVLRSSCGCPAGTVQRTPVRSGKRVAAVRTATRTNGTPAPAARRRTPKESAGSDAGGTAGTSAPRRTKVSVESAARRTAPVPGGAG